MNELQPVALERDEATADLVVTGGSVYGSNRRAVLERDVAVVGDRIAALLDDADAVVGPETTVIDASGRYVLPGLIDAHTHADLKVTPERAVPGTLESGTTSIVTETSGLGLHFGARGVETTLERTAGSPVTTYLAVPPQPFVDTFEPPRGDADALEDCADLLERDRVIGVGEIDWIHVVGHEPPLSKLVDAAHDSGGVVVGHGAGCRGDSLRAFATVVDNDHEAIAAEGMRERAAAGVHVVGRCGSNRDDLPALAAAAPDLDPASVSLSTDGIDPDELLEGVGMADVVARAIELGIPAQDAIDAATRNPAEQFGLEGRGRIAAGAYADLLVVDDLESMGVETVVANGEVVVADGSATVAPSTDPYPDYVTEMVSIDDGVGEDRFTAPASAAPDGVVRALAVGSGLVTTETVAEPAVTTVEGDAVAGGAAGDRLGPDPNADVLTATLLDRTPATDRGFTGFLTGFGLESGAVATSATWERIGLTTVAADPADAVVAARRVAELNGGFAVARDGDVVADLELPVAGVASNAPLEDVADGYEALEDALRRGGVEIDDPLVTLETLTFPGVPALKLTPSGYADVLGQQVVGLDPETEAGAADVESDSESET
ncbi:adenine deaminase C-terminal domain-containing protein [Natronolimnohabitans innermongolicus]|uniref:adenine deaminase n=1 Tax=Natronolimnohabitans innermongolicus JCM 12255 TaxID=1227499 RepID=L9X7H2_9EURY|nr:adenine deaminase C-terminal domain-containing protein [Natronolimnohabitans innermongolicus]ELY57675.1 adenine deaminase [Natronolimnohabitans innermongolicus JCM 12255]